jgi:two-component system alkaline phosphatase synthesis response regulator PhoP
MSRLLIIEDEPTIGMGLQDDLEIEGHTVDLRTDGITGEAAALRNEHDLIVLDLMLPEKDGLSVCRSLRLAGIRTPIIMLTAKGQEGDKIAGLELGADDYVTKPFSPRELVARINAVLRRPAETRSMPLLRSGTLTIDFARYEAARNGRGIDLTALEFKLLRALVDRRGEVLTHHQLLELVWGRNVFLTDRVIYTHINNLRQKIEETPSTPALIIGVRGVGYRFDG